jgi:hypothetical protein
LAGCQRGLRELFFMRCQASSGDYNAMPTDLDVYAPERWRDALFRPEVREAYRLLTD